MGGIANRNDYRHRLFQYESPCNKRSPHNKIEQFLSSLSGSLSAKTDRESELASRCAKRSKTSQSLAQCSQRARTNNDKARWKDGEEGKEERKRTWVWTIFRPLSFLREHGRVPFSFRVKFLKALSREKNNICVLNINFFTFFFFSIDA